MAAQETPSSAGTQRFHWVGAPAVVVVVVVVVVVHVKEFEGPVEEGSAFRSRPAARSLFFVAMQFSFRVWI